MVVLIIIALVLLILVALAMSTVATTNNKEDARLAREEKKQKEREEREIKLALVLQELEERYGKPTMEIKLQHGSWEWDNLNYRIYIYEEPQTILIEQQPIPFKKILGYTLTDNQSTITTTQGKADTQTSTGSMAGRALVGGVLLGGAGAVAGAATAKKNTDINTTTKHTTTHSYVIYLSVDDMSNPQRILKFGSDADSANKAASVFNIIINRNSQ